jgi:hypothetical protein
VLLAGATGFEPAISCLTGRYVKPGYTTPPLSTCSLYHRSSIASNCYCQTKLLVSLGGLTATPASEPAASEKTVTFQLTCRSAPSES